VAVHGGVVVVGGRGVELCCRPYSAGVLHSVSDRIQNLQYCEEDYSFVGERTPIYQYLSLCISLLSDARGSWDGSFSARQPVATLLKGIVSRDWIGPCIV
jgi:hypothetical protein